MCVCKCFTTLVVALACYFILHSCIYFPIFFASCLSFVFVVFLCFFYFLDILLDSTSIFLLTIYSLPFFSHGRIIYTFLFESLLLCCLLLSSCSIFQYLVWVCYNTSTGIPNNPSGQLLSLLSL